MEKKLWQQKRRKDLQVAATRREKKCEKKNIEKQGRKQGKGKAAALGKEGNEGGNLGILFSQFYLLKLMSFFWFNLRIMCN